MSDNKLIEGIDNVNLEDEAASQVIFANIVMIKLYLLGEVYWKFS
jgi:hypothetical protein